jgi:nucleotide-binding universal stress UspA family protein
MISKVLVPLDGSPFAEQALPHARSIVRRAGATLDLVHVHVPYALTDPACGRYAFVPELDREHRRQEGLYLEDTAKSLSAAAQVPASAAVVDGLDSDGILQRVQDSKADLIVMTTHARGPLGRFFQGGVADDLIRHAAIPLLLVRPRDADPGLVSEPLLEHMLVPLDGSALAECVLEPALNMIRLWKGHCTLLRVVNARSGPDQAGAEAEARAYLQKIAERLGGEGVSVQPRVVIAPDPASAILEEAQTQRCDFIAMATHGRGGLIRMLLGSVADTVIRGSSIPILVYRPSA